MQFRTWPVAALGLSSLLVLIVVSMLASSRQAQEIYSQLDRLNAHHQTVDTKLRRLRSDVNLSGIFVRDYLLDVARERAPEYRERLAAFRQSTTTTVAELRGSPDIDPDRIRSLEAQLDAYWTAFEPLFDWTITEKIFRSAGFLRQEVVPRREAALTIAQEIEELNNANLVLQREEVARRQDAFRRQQERLLLQTMLLGTVVALIAVFRLRVLERRSEEQRAKAEEAERQTRQLTEMLVATQEEERRNLSRELHDHVAQVLTALRMELSRIDRTRPAADHRIAAAVAECKSLVDGLFRTVRNLALGLRPSMLDDFGLQAALEWLVRDVTGRYGLDVQLHMEGDFDGLPDRHRTCVYRAVQEALTNCVRHAQARAIRIAIARHGGEVEVQVSDDGVGIGADRLRSGLGLRGIEERVHELGGVMTIERGRERGTALRIALPWPSVEVPRARAAG